MMLSSPRGLETFAADRLERIVIVLFGDHSNHVALCHKSLSPLELLKRSEFQSILVLIVKEKACSPPLEALENLVDYSLKGIGQCQAQREHVTAFLCFFDLCYCLWKLDFVFFHSFVCKEYTIGNASCKRSNDSDLTCKHTL